MGRGALFTRRHALGALGGIGAGALAGAARAAEIAPNWSSLAAAYKVPGWFRDAKFGIWAHWGPQCVPEYGDWYGRQMYQQGNRYYDHHLQHYGHPADTGFIDIIGQWKAEHWDPEHLIGLYKAAGAKYFMALGCHHDNLDTFDSAHHEWNTTRVGPKRDMIGTWEKAVRKAGLRFGVSNHSSHAWHWWQTAYGYDAEGPRAGERYDAFKLRKEDGAGKYWDGLDPQALYTGPAMVPPNGIATRAAMQDWVDVHSGRWMEFAPEQNPLFVAKWLARQKDMVEKYRPDIIYQDGYGLPFGSVGLEALAHYYDHANQVNGAPDVVMTVNHLSDFQQRALVESVERGFSDHLRARPWQTATCIGDWHYNRGRYDNKSYVPAEQVIQRLCDVVSKNGNLLLSIPVRGDGTIDSEEEKIVAGITKWMQIYGEAAIFGSRPYRVYGEGPTRAGGGEFGEGKVKFVSGDVRYTVKDGALFVAMLVFPDDKLVLKALPKNAVIERVTLVTGSPPLSFKQTPDGLEITIPIAGMPGVVEMLRIDGKGIV
jgi:alpha-L-fucosidase